MINPGTKSDVIPFVYVIFGLEKKTAFYFLLILQPSPSILLSLSISVSFSLSLFSLSLFSFPIYAPSYHSMYPSKSNSIDNNSWYPDTIKQYPGQCQCHDALLTTKGRP